MLKLANKEQSQFYRDRLYPMQDEIFELMQSEKFYLSGGTCLSRFYYQHRYSDDLDFFFQGNQFSQKEFEAETVQILERIKRKFHLEFTVNAEYFKRLIIYQDGIGLKVEFIYEPSSVIGARIPKQNIQIDTKENIVTNKLTAIQGRKTLKDYFDLYFLLKEFELSQVIKWSELKIVPLNYEGMFLSLVEGSLQGDVVMIQEVSLQEFQKFQKELTRELLNHAKTVS